MTLFNRALSRLKSLLRLSPAGTARQAPEHRPSSAENSLSFLKDILGDFLRDIEYKPEQPITSDNASYQALKTEFGAFNTGLWFDELCRNSAKAAEYTYPHHSDEVRLQIARCTWFFLYIDDIGHKFPEYLINFQKCILTGENTLKDDLFKAHREFLVKYCGLFAPIPANLIILSCLDVVNGCVLEETPEIRDMVLTENAQSWPYFLRKKTCHSQAYAYMLFPNEANLDMSNYIQAIDDMVLFIDLSNDLLSFYKEYLARERRNYVYTRSLVTKRTVEETLKEMIDEALAAHERTSKVLGSPLNPALPTWKKFVNGYVAFHLYQDRYRLQELDILSVC